MLTIIPNDIKFDDCSLITGFHGIGGTGYWTVRYLIQELNAKRVAFIDSDSLPPATTTFSGGLITPHEIYKSGDLIFFKVEVPPYKDVEISFFKSLAKWVIDAGFKEAALIGGLDSSLRTDSSNFRFVHTRSFVPKGVLTEALFLEDDRLIVGPLAIMLNYFEIMDFPAFATLAYASTKRIDPRATAEAISVIGKYYQFNVDTTPLLKGAEALELEVAKQEARGRKGGESIYT